MKVLSHEEALRKFREFQRLRNYTAMYSSVLGGIVKSPELMFIPIDDHLVHRGDGIFEAFRFSSKGIFLLQPHLERLFKSAELISLGVPWSMGEIEDISREVVKASGMESGQVRIFVSRGPGDFSPNPYSTVGSQLYIIAMPFKAMDRKFYSEGGKLILCSVPIKPSFFSRVKSCNYLPNVLMKKESLDRGADFAVNLTPEGYVAEGPTENIMIVDKQNRLLAPQFDYTLRGTTLLEVMRIARENQKSLGLEEVDLQHLSVDDLKFAKEIMMVGTTLGALPITNIDSAPVGDGKVGPVAKFLNSELAKLI